MFKKGQSGNPNGKEPGKRNAKTEQWEALAESITGAQAANFHAFMDELWNGNMKEKIIAADLYLKTVEYFKPKQQKVTATVDGEMSVIFGRRDAPDRDTSK